MILQFMCSSKLSQKIPNWAFARCPEGYNAHCSSGIWDLRICCTPRILAAPGTLARKASPAWALGASSCRFRADFLCTLQENGKGMAKLPGMTQQQKGFRKGNVPAPSTALAELAGTRDKLTMAQLAPDNPIPQAGKQRAQRISLLHSRQISDL